MPKLVSGIFGRPHPLGLLCSRLIRFACFRTSIEPRRAARRYFSVRLARSRGPGRGCPASTKSICAKPSNLGSSLREKWRWTVIGRIRARPRILGSRPGHLWRAAPADSGSLQGHGLDFAILSCLELL